ncbi:hypothetical protein JK358_37045 [Nocardia sp. 2]|uniref:Uncharacterized protein n=1 Tax=Nocardia acididurans TaxID=2802282 RepID=A0ABS1ML70_9NOCA|nr:hypothetical protein [Nocardia acididurans]MBL1080018.1 hypothetical protein [Nocardia acididurans]
MPLFGAFVGYFTDWLALQLTPGSRCCRCCTCPTWGTSHGHYPHAPRELLISADVDVDWRRRGNRSGDELGR